MESVTLIAQQTRGIHPMVFQSWHTVCDAGPTLKQHWVNAPCLLGGHCTSFTSNYDAARAELMTNCFKRTRIILYPSNSLKFQALKVVEQAKASCIWVRGI